MQSEFVAGADKIKQFSAVTPPIPFPGGDGTRTQPLQGIVGKPGAKPPATPWPGEICEITINKISSKGSGIVDFSNNYKLIIPVLSKEIKIGQKVKIGVTRVKRNYAFGKLLEPRTSSSLILSPQGRKEATASEEGGASVYANRSLQDVAFQTKINDSKLSNQNEDFLKRTLDDFRFPMQKIDQVNPVKLVGSKYTMTLPKKCKKYGNFIVLNLENSTLFVKLALGSKLGALRKVRIKLTKVTPTYSIGKIIQINPTSAKKKTTYYSSSFRSND